MKKILTRMLSLVLCLVFTLNGAALPSSVAAFEKAEDTASLSEAAIVLNLPAAADGVADIGTVEYTLPLSDKTINSDVASSNSGNKIVELSDAANGATFFMNYGSAKTVASDTLTVAPWQKGERYFAGATLKKTGLSAGKYYLVADFMVSATSSGSYVTTTTEAAPTNGFAVDPIKGSGLTLTADTWYTVVSGVVTVKEGAETAFYLPWLTMYNNCEVYYKNVKIYKEQERTSLTDYTLPATLYKGKSVLGAEGVTDASAIGKLMYYMPFENVGELTYGEATGTAAEIKEASAYIGSSDPAYPGRDQFYMSLDFPMYENAYKVLYNQVRGDAVSITADGLKVDAQEFAVGRYFSQAYVNAHALKAGTYYIVSDVKIEGGSVKTAYANELSSPVTTAPNVGEWYTYVYKAASLEVDTKGVTKFGLPGFELGSDTNVYYDNISIYYREPVNVTITFTTDDGTVSQDTLNVKTETVDLSSITAKSNDPLKFFAGWKVKGSDTLIQDLKNYPVTGDVTLEAVFATPERKGSIDVSRYGDLLLYDDFGTKVENVGSAVQYDNIGVARNGNVYYTSTDYENAKLVCYITEDKDNPPIYDAENGYYKVSGRTAYNYLNNYNGFNISNVDANSLVHLPKGTYFVVVDLMFGEADAEKIGFGVPGGGYSTLYDIGTYTPGEWNTYANSFYSDGTLKGRIESVVEYSENGVERTFCYDNLAIYYLPDRKITFSDGLNLTKDKTLTVSGQYLTQEQLEQLGTLTNSGATFLGWSTEENGDIIDPTKFYTAEDTTLYAVWEGELVQLEPVTYMWDFENNTTESWTTSASGYALKVEKGVLTVDTSAEAASGGPYIKHGAVSLNTETHRYFVAKLRSLSDADKLEFFFKTDEMDSFSEALQINMTPNSDVFEEFAIDLSQNPNWTGNYTECMIKLGEGKGKVEIEELGFVTEYVDPAANAPVEYHFDLSKVKVSGDHSIVHNADGTITFSRTGGTGSMDLVFSDAIDATQLKKLVFKVKAPFSEVFRTYFTTSYDSTPNEDKTSNSNVLLEVDGYAYAVCDFTGKDGAQGAYKSIWLKIEDNNSAVVEIADIYLTDRLEVVANGTVDKAAIYTSKDSITSDSGEITVNSYVRYVDGREEWGIGNVVTDSVNGLLTKNDDGTWTLTGKINGDVTLKLLVPGSDMTGEKKITISGQNDRYAINDFRVMVFGNSIMSHADYFNAETNELIWPGGNFGMAASGPDKDYTSRLIYYMKQKYGDNAVTLKREGGVATFARAFVADDVNYDYSSYFKNFVADVEDFGPNVIVMQMGENCNTVGITPESYAHAMTSFLEAIIEASPDDVLVVMCTPLFGGASKIKGAKLAAEELGISCVELHPLRVSENLATEYLLIPGGEGVAGHPNDKGMEEIAKVFYNEINTILSVNERTVYTEAKPESIEFVNPVTAITKDCGTALFTAEVYPENAAQAVVWSVDNKNIATIDENGLLTAVNNGTVTVTAASKYDDEVYKTVEVEISGQTTPYTVTYNANTTDTVTKLPSPNTNAKKNFKFNDGYPERKYYSFVGWSLTPDGDVLESYDVTKDITVYAIWEIAHRWNFSRGITEQFKVVNGFNVYVTDEKLTAIQTGTTDDNRIKFTSPELKLNAADYKQLEIKVQNTEILYDTVMSLTVKATGGNKNFTVPVKNKDYNTYVFDLSSVTGTITGFEFAPTNVDCTVCLEYAAFISAVGEEEAPDTNDSIGIRVKDPMGMRVIASVTDIQREGAIEYGFLVARNDALEGSELTFETDVKFVQGKAFVKEGEDITTDYVYAIDDAVTSFAGVLIDIPESKAAYKAYLTFRPYLKTGESVYYGEPVSMSLYEAAKVMKAGTAYSELDNDGKNVINKIITLGEN